MGLRYRRLVDSRVLPERLWGAYREATLLGPEGIASFRPREQADQCRFANTWARTLRQQGFVAAARGQRGARGR